MRLGKQLRDEGVARAIDGYTSLVEYVEDFVLRNYAGKEIVFEEIRMMLERDGIHPRTKNTWGALANVLRKRGVLFDTGKTTISESPSAHARLTRIWRVSLL